MMEKKKIILLQKTIVDPEREWHYVLHKLYDELRKWGRYTTFHGIPVIFRTRSWSLKIFWLILFFISFGLCCFMLNKNFAEYFQYNVATVIRTKPTKMLRFPLVTVCNIDYFVGKKAEEYIKDYMRSTYNATIESFQDFFTHYPNYDDFLTEINWITLNAFDLASKNETFAKSLGLSANEFFYSIKLGGKSLKLDNTTIRWYFDPFYGNCFRINYQSGLNSDFDIVNVNTGLHLEMYAGKPSSLSFSSIRGFTIEIKSHDAYPYVFTSKSIEVGVFKNLILSPKMFRILPKPYSSCVSIDTYFSPHTEVMKKLGMSYSREYCLDINSQLMIIRDYGCYHPVLPPIPGYLPCNRTIYKTSKLIRYQFRDNSEVCPIECEYHGYSIRESNDEYPTRNYAKLMLATKSDQLEDMLNAEIENITYETIRNNFASVYIRFNNLAVTEKIEQVAVPFTLLISNLGGTLGLFVALSVLSVLEIFEFGIVTAFIFYQVHFRKTNPKS